MTPKKISRIYKKMFFRKEKIIIFAELSTEENLFYCITKKNRRRAID